MVQCTTLREFKLTHQRTQRRASWLTARHGPPHLHPLQQMHRLRSTWRRLGPYDSDSFKERMRRCQQKFHVVVVTRTIEKNNLIWWNYSTILLATLTLSSIWSSVWVDNSLLYVKTPHQSCIILNHTHRVIYLGSKWVCPKTGYLKKYDYHYYPIWSVSNNWHIIGHFPHFHTEVHGNGMSMLSSADSLDLLMLLLDFLCISLWVGIQPRLAILQSLNGNLDEHLPATQRKHPEETSSII